MLYDRLQLRHSNPPIKAYHCPVHVRVSDKELYGVRELWCNAKPPRECNVCNQIILNLLRHHHTKRSSDYSWCYSAYTDSMTPKISSYWYRHAANRCLRRR